MADNKLELFIDVNAKSGNAEIISFNRGMDNLGKTAGAAGRRASSGIDGLTASITKGILAAGGIVAIARQAAQTLKHFTLGAIETQDEMGKTAQKIGLTVREFSELRHVAELAGADVGQLSTSVGFLSKNMLAAAQGSKAQKETFAALGLQIKNTDGTLRSANNVLEDLADRFKSLPDGATKSALAMAALGRSGREMIPFLNQGGEAIRAARVEANELGRVIDERTAKAAEQFQDNLSRLRGAAEGLAFKIAENLLPTLVELTDRTVEWAKHSDAAAKISAYLRDLIQGFPIVVTSLSVAFDGAKIAVLSVAKAFLKLQEVMLIGIPGGVLFLKGIKEQLAGINAEIESARVSMGNGLNDLDKLKGGVLKAPKLPVLESSRPRGGLDLVIEEDATKAAKKLKEITFDMESEFTRAIENASQTRQKMIDADFDLLVKNADYLADLRLTEQENQLLFLADADEASAAAAKQQVEQAHQAYLEIFNDLKTQAGGVFDALLTKSQSVWTAIGNLFKTTILTAIKDTFTQAVATILTPFMASVRAAISNGAKGFGLPGLGPGGTAGITGPVEVKTKLDLPNHIGDLGLVGGAVPVVMANSALQQTQYAQQVAQTGTLGRIAASLGGLFGLASLSKAGTPAGAVTSTIDYGQGPLAAGSAVYGGSAGTAPTLSGASQAGGFAGALGGLKGFLGLAGKAPVGGIGPTQAFGALSLGGKLSALGKSNAALLGGGLLAADGIRRGGVLGLAETTAGGALIGFKYGGPLGAGIGAAIGAGIGVFGLFRKSAEKKAAEKIKAMYGVDMKDKALLKQIVQTAKQSFGGNIDVAIASKDVRELIQLYAMTTGQSGKFPKTVQAVSLAQSGGSIYQNFGYENGRSLGASSLVNSPVRSVDNIAAGVSGGGSSSGGSSQEITLRQEIPIMMDGRVIETKVLDTIIRNGRVISTAANQGLRASAGRRQATANLIAPNLIVS